MQGAYLQNAAKGFKSFPSKKRIHRMIPRIVPRRVQSKWQLKAALFGVALLSSVALISFTCGFTGVHHRRLPAKCSSNTQPIKLKIGDRVRVTGLKTNQELNGKFGIVLEENEPADFRSKKKFPGSWWVKLEFDEPVDSVEAEYPIYRENLELESEVRRKKKLLQQLDKQRKALREERNRLDKTEIAIDDGAIKYFPNIQTQAVGHNPRISPLDLRQAKIFKRNPKHKDHITKLDRIERDLKQNERQIVKIIGQEEYNKRCMREYKKVQPRQPGWGARDIEDYNGFYRKDFRAACSLCGSEYTMSSNKHSGFYYESGYCALCSQLTDSKLMWLKGMRNSTFFGLKPSAERRKMVSNIVKQQRIRTQFKVGRKAIVKNACGHNLRLGEKVVVKGNLLNKNGKIYVERIKSKGGKRFVKIAPSCLQLV